jgi:hypothetical protein
VVGLLVDRGGFPLEIGCFEGNRAETSSIIPVVKAFQARHDLADMVVVADAGMLSANNLRELDGAGLRFIVGSRMTKARSTWSPISAGTATRSATGSWSTPSPRGLGGPVRITRRCAPNRSGNPTSTRDRGGRSRPTRPSGQCGTARP